MSRPDSGSARSAGPPFPDAGLSAWAPAAALLGMLWLLIFNQQRLEWSVNVIYAYGWAVPAMAVYLLWERRRTRPLAQPPSRTFALAGLVTVAVLLAAYLPVRVIQEANPDWVKINWGLAALGIGVAWLAFALAGGLRQALHFTFPLLFCLTALPWPVWLDNWIVQSLMRGNATVCAELLTWMGTPALAEGNLIQVAERWVNVEEACSGIRSLQTAFMMSLFLGELHRLTLPRRLGLVAASFGVAFLLNIGRTLLLTRLTVIDEALVDRWHDPVGVVAMIVCLIALWALSEWFRPDAPPTPPSQRPVEGHKSQSQKSSLRAAPAAPHSTFDLRPSDLRLSAPLPIGFALAGILWLVSAELLTGAWYRHHEHRVPPALVWDVAWPKTAPEFQYEKFAERTLALLKFDTGETASWQAEGAYPWQMYALHWTPGRVSKFLSSAHHPTVCLPATGLELVRELGGWECEANGVRLPFSTYLFSQGGQDVYVFHAIIEDRPRRDGEPVTYRQVDTSERLRSVWRGERNLGQHVIGIALLGASSPGDAREIAQRTLDSVIQPQP